MNETAALTLGYGRFICREALLACQSRVVRGRCRPTAVADDARGERRAAAAWVGAGERAQRLVGARVTDEHEWPVGAVGCVHDLKMDEPWCLVASEATVPTRILIRYYGKRWGIEAGFRDIKNMRFGMGLSSMHVSQPDRRDCLLLISALAIAVLSLLGAAGERIGYDRWLKANTVKRRTHSLFRQGLMLYHHLPNWPEDRIRPLMETFGSMLIAQRAFREVFGVI
ncbi:MAG: transposase [Acidobacteria bacterium]|nr:transposase [Acidobacteriota bacterium]